MESPNSEIAEKSGATPILKSLDTMINSASFRVYQQLLRQTFRTEPKALSIICQELARRAGAVAKDIDRAAQRILVQRLATESRQAIYPLAEVDGLHGQKDATLGGELEH